jgi:predicted PurR-regulated permease PerM
VGEKVGLHPVVAILALILFAKWFGFVGLLLAVPATAVLKVFLLDGLRRYRESGFFQEGAPPEEKERAGPVTDPESDADAPPREEDEGSESNE